MLSSESEVAEAKAQQLVCTGSMKPVAEVCVQEGCTAHPLLCADEDCSCQTAHEQHLKQKLNKLLKRIQDKPTDFTDFKRAEKTMQILFAQLGSELEKARQKHDKFIQDLLNQQPQKPELETKLLNKQEVPP